MHGRAMAAEIWYHVAREAGAAARAGAMRELEQLVVSGMGSLNDLWLPRTVVRDSTRKISADVVYTWRSLLAG